MNYTSENGHVLVHGESCLRMSLVQRKCVSDLYSNWNMPTNKITRKAMLKTES